MTPRYILPADENSLFTTGVTSWRLDVQTSQVLSQILANASWGKIPDSKNGAPFVGETPVGHLTSEQSQNAADAVELALNDPVLFPQVRQMGKLVPQAVELQNGAFDDGWHHDHLSNKRGHAGHFFFIAYMGEKTWDPEWGGGFHYGERDLTGNWVTNIKAPQTSHVIWPTFRTALLGWNENPKLIHRAEFLRAPKNRTAFLMPVNRVAF
jgi:hypothetical protein